MNRCRSTLTEIADEGFSAAALNALADRRTFPHRLPFLRADIMEIRADTARSMSISGVQEKISLRLHRGELLPVADGGEYLLKPIPGQRLSRFQEDVPANEHITMLLARQVFGIETAPNACILLKDDEPAYITRRFDRTRNGEKIAQEDFCQLMERSPTTSGPNYKYDGSYEELAMTLRRFCSAYAIEGEKLFRRLLFNYAVANGDAHLKNFSLHQTSFGDYVLTPAYDLLCTKLHIPNESRLALDLFAHDEEPHGVTNEGFSTGADFLELARRMGLKAARAAAILDDICDHRDEVTRLVSRSFLSPEARLTFLEILDDRLRALQIR